MIDRIEPDYRYKRTLVRAIFFVLSVIHIIVTGIVFLSYMIIQRPKLPMHGINDLTEKLCG